MSIGRVSGGSHARKRNTEEVSQFFGFQNLFAKKVKKTKKVLEVFLNKNTANLLPEDLMKKPQR